MDLHEEAFRKLKDCGLSVTPQRLAIFRYLLSSREHPDAETIYRDMGPSLSSMSLATVYKTLDTLVKHRLIRRLNPLNETARYDAQMSPHQHLICDVCGKVMDVELDLVELLSSRISQSHDFTPSGVNVHVFGKCGPCGSASEAKERG